MGAGDFFLLLATIHFASSIGKIPSTILGLFWSCAAMFMLIHKYQ